MAERYQTGNQNLVIRGLIVGAVLGLSEAVAAKIHARVAWETLGVGLGLWVVAGGIGGLFVQLFRPLISERMSGSGVLLAGAIAIYGIVMLNHQVLRGVGMIDPASLLAAGGILACAGLFVLCLDRRLGQAGHAHFAAYALAILGTLIGGNFLRAAITPDPVSLEGIGMVAAAFVLAPAVAGLITAVLRRVLRFGLPDSIATGFAALVVAAIPFVAGVYFVRPSWIGIETTPRRALNRPAKPNVVLVVLDTVRADRLSCYNAEARPTPNLDKLAAQGVRFPHAISTSPWTLPAHASLFTSTYPSRHGAVHVDSDWEARPLGPQLPTLAETLTQYGYETSAIVANRGFLDPFYGLDRGFGWYEVLQPKSDGLFWNPIAQRTPLRRYYRLNTNVLAPEVNEQALAWIDRRSESQKPFFLFVNFMDAHGSPFLPDFSDQVGGLGLTPGDIENLGEIQGGAASLDENQRWDLATWYTKEVQYLDDQLGQLFEDLKQREIWDDSLVIVTSDHGELLGEHGGVGHELYLDEEVLRVPLIVKYPRGTNPADVDHWVQTVDIAPEILRVASIPAPETYQGILPGYRTDNPIAELFTNRTLRSINRNRFGQDRTAIYSPEPPGWKYISGTSEEQLFDLANDPQQAKNAAKSHPKMTNLLRRRFAKWLTSFEKFPIEPEPSPEVAAQGGEQARDAIRQMGYAGEKR
ncbi:MAG: sulfatase-like hydrolase/transferase [Planctomycetota bacterium]